MSADQSTLQNPLNQYPAPDFPQQLLAHPGNEEDMRPKPDYGENSYRGTGRLNGRRAVITGGDSGIGRAVAIAFAREGANVLITHLPAEETDAKVTLSAMKSAGTQIAAQAADLQNITECAAIIAQAEQEFGGLDILVNNAAYQMYHKGGILEISEEEFDRTFRTNVTAAFFLAKAAFAKMPPGSSIITTVSIEAYQPNPALLAYAMTKGALVNFTKGLALQGIERGIRVNAVAPGPVWTPLIPSTMPLEKVRSFGRNESPMKRPAQPAELAHAYVFLASQDASYINGHILGVTGGKSTN